MIELKLARVFTKKKINLKEAKKSSHEEQKLINSSLQICHSAFPPVFMNCHWSPLNFNLPISKLFKSIFAVLSWYWFSCYFLPHFYFIFSRLQNFLFSSSFCGCQKFLLLSFHVPFKKWIFISTVEKFTFLIFLFLLFSFFCLH